MYDKIYLDGCSATTVLAVAIKTLHGRSELDNIVD